MRYPWKRTQPDGSVVGVPVTLPEVTPVRIVRYMSACRRFAPVSDAPVMLARARSAEDRLVWARFAPKRLANGPTKYPATRRHPDGSDDGEPCRPPVLM